MRNTAALSSRMRKLLLRKMPLSPQRRLILSTARGAMMLAWVMPLSLWNVQTWMKKQFVRSCTLWNPASTSSRCEKLVTITQEKQLCAAGDIYAKMQRL